MGLEHTRHRPPANAFGRILFFVLPVKRFDLLLRHNNMTKRAEPIDVVGVSR